MSKRQDEKIASALFSLSLVTAAAAAAVAAAFALGVAGCVPTDGV
ncbi:uncharacterized protein CTRU02_204990 [Colletotrichum truncatum]|uniref:Uncharacterized protein n=1 Tax=Colletotrichum truncatum TaxID=5467 RepID=A0ACC3Z2T0_COLTU